MLRVTLHINTRQIGDYEIRNVGATGHGDHRYEIRPIDGRSTGDLIGTVYHYQAAGAERLASNALDVIARHRSTASRNPLGLTETEAEDYARALTGLRACGGDCCAGKERS